MPINSRIRDNNVFGLVEDNPLTVSASSMNSIGLLNLSVVASNHAILTLDPLRQFGNPEIVIVTVHTAASTIVTITRGAYGTSPREHPQGTLWVHAPIDEDFIDIVTSSTHPLDPYEGQFIFETDTNKLVGYDGSNWAPRDAGGRVGYSQAVVDQNGIATGSPVDVTSLVVAWTAVPTRHYKLTGHVLIQKITNAGNFDARITDGSGNEVQRIGQGTFAIGELRVLSSSVVETGLSGVITRKIQVFSSTASANILAATTRPNFILVEDIGAV